MIDQLLPISLGTLIFLLCAAGFAGWIDAVVGGGGLVQLPALVIGLPKEMPTAYVLGTNKTSSFMGTLVASAVYLRRLRVQVVMLLPLLIGAYAGSTTGAALSRYLPRDVLTPVVLVAVIGVGIYTFRKKSLGLTHAPRFTERGPVIMRAALIGSIVGLYDGALGPGTGSFFVIAIVVFLGYGFLEASVNAKLANLVTNLASIVVYGVHGEIVLLLALLMGAMNVTGGFIGARMAVKNGSVFVRRVFLVVIAILSVKLAYDTVVAFLPAG